MKRTSAADDSVMAFLSGGGELGARIAQFDWAQTPLGFIAGWPQSLKTAVGLLLRSPVPMVLLWGPDGVMLYNDSYSVFAGGRHPKLLGSKVREGWPEVADFNDHVMKTGLAGGTLSYRDQELTLSRHGTPEQVWMNLDYSPVLDESGEPGGVIAIVVETTAKVRAESWLTGERERLRQMFEQAPGFMALLDGPTHIFVFGNQAYQQLIGHRNVIGKPIREALPDIAGQGFFELLDQLYASGENFSGRAVSVKLQRVPDAPMEDRLVDFIFQPLRDTGGLVTGIFVEGYDVTEATQAETRRAALAELSDRIRDIEDPDALAYAAAEILGRTLDVSRAGYGTIDMQAETITIERDWNAPGIQSIAGVLKFRDYGSYIEQLKRGETVIVADAEKDSRTADTAAALKAISAAAFVNMPVTEMGDVVALLYLNHARAREWPEEELAFVREVAGRTRTGFERRRAESALRESEAQFRNFAEAAPNHVWTSLPDGTVDWFNARVYAYTGAATGALDGQAWTRVIHPDDIATTGQRWMESLISGNPYENEFRVRRADGVYRWHIARAVPIRTDGKITRWIGSNTDIEDQKAATDALAHLNETLEQQVAERTADRDRMWRLSTDIMLVAKFDGEIVAVNPAAAQLLGWSESELVGRSFLDFVHPDDRAETKAELGSLRLGVITMKFENRYRRKDGGYRTLSWAAVPDERLVHAVGRDVTTDRAAAETLRRTEAALSQAQKMEAVGQLTGGVAHDFNNLLMAILSSLELMRKRLPDDARTLSFLDNAVQAAQRGASLTQRMLAFARRQDLTTEAVDLGRLVSGMTELFERSMGPLATLRTELADRLPPVDIDANQLEMALLNLVVNARDAMPDGGSVVIAAHRQSDKPETDGAVRDYVCLSVTDTGEGMDEATLAHATEPFFTTKGIGKGTGLGLSMVHGLAAQAGGRLVLESSTGKGTRAELWLPISEHPQAAETPLPALPLPAPAMRPLTILAVDDDMLVRMNTVAMLEDLGHTVFEAASGQDALEILGAEKSIDLLISDQAMPQMTGAQLAEKVRAARPGMPIILATGYAQLPPGAGAALQRLAKPFTERDLEHAIARAFQDS